MANVDDIRALAEPALAAAGLSLWDVEVGPEVLRIFVERDGGVDLDTLSAASTALSGLLDDHDELVPGDTYHLEVSSPGLERTLRSPEQFRRYVGTTVTVKTSAPVGGGRRHRGVLVDVGADGIVLAADDTPGTPFPVPYDLIERARTVLEWGPAPKPTSKPGRSPRPPRAAQAAAAADAAEVAPGARDTKDRAR